MSFNGTGIFTINTAGQPVVPNTTITSTAFNLLTADLASGLTNTLTKDGQSTPTANIKMGAFKLTNVGVPTSTGDALSFGNVATISTLTLTNALTVANGGTGATTASGARTNLSAASSGANSDITSLTGLTTALAVVYGGTGSTTASGARTNLGAASSGANSDITSLTGLTTPLSIAQGGTNASTATAAFTNMSFLSPGTGAVARSASTKAAEIVSVKDFGATGDGTTDDTASIQAAIDYLQNASGGTVNFPAGTYVVSSTLTVGNGSTYSTTSSSSVLVGSGSKTFTVATGRTYTNGDAIVIVNSSTIAMKGTITSYNSGTGALVVNITTYIGSGTLSSWTVSTLIPNTKAPVRLAGFGASMGVGYATPNGGTVLKSSVAGYVVRFNCCLGWGFENISITWTTASASAGGIIQYECWSGKMENVTMFSPPNTGLSLQTYGFNNLTFNNYNNVFIFMGATYTTSVGLICDGVGVGGDVALNSFNGLHITPAVATQTGIILKYADTNAFFRVDVNPAACKGLVLDYSGNPDFPNSNQFFAGDVYNNTITPVGTISALGAVMPNEWHGWGLLNNAAIPTTMGFTTDRVKLSQNSTFYVSTTGSATSFGVFAGNPALTLQQMYNTLTTYFDLNGYTATISVASGTYSAGITAVIPPVGNGQIIVVGTGGGSVLSVTTGPIFSAKKGCSLQLQAMNLTTTSGSSVAADGGEIVIGSGTIFGASGGSHVTAINGGLVRLTALYYIIGNATSHYSATQGGKIVSTGTTLYFLSNVTTTQFAFADGASNINLPSMTFTLGAYSATGSRYTSQVYSLIDTNGGGASYFPGSTAGTASTGTYR